VQLVPELFAQLFCAQQHLDRARQLVDALTGFADVDQHRSDAVVLADVGRRGVRFLEQLERAARLALIERELGELVQALDDPERIADFTPDLER
jgi:hypothetical protein